MTTPRMCTSLQGMWQHIQTIIDRHLHYIMENQYQKLNKKLDVLSIHDSRHHNKQNIDFVKVNLLLINILISPFKLIHSLLPHCHNGPFIFLVILNSVTLTTKLRAP
jgi:hypothetical protein